MAHTLLEGFNKCTVAWLSSRTNTLSLQHLASDLEEVIEYSSIKLAYDTKLGRTVLRASLSCRGTQTGCRNRLTQEHNEIL